MIKIALSSAVALGMAFTGAAANAEAIRSGAATPGVVSVNKAKLARTTAPAKNESKAFIASDSTLFTAALAAAAAGVAGYFIVHDNNNNVIGVDSPGA